MRKLIVLFVLFIISDHVCAQNWDRHMQVKKMDISIRTDAFTATTFIEMEFFNPTSTEMEGLYTFQLEPGQVITAFQLELFGKFRNGSIEEKWKASNAYNTIVGKRVDPALLRMDSYNQYSLRIYPVPGRGSRKITMTIQQVINVNNGRAIYKLPLKILDTIEQMNVHINSTHCDSTPSVIKGFSGHQFFKGDNMEYKLVWAATSVRATEPISFSIPVIVNKPVLCTKTAGGKTFFALRMRSEHRREYTINPRKVTVFWDVSVSGRERMIWKEISFLREYVSRNNIEQLTIIRFNHFVKDTAVFYTTGNFNSRWVQYLHSQTYEGATQLGILDFSVPDTDAILLFTDGHNGFGKNLPQQGKVHVYAVQSSDDPDRNCLERIIGVTGGKYIDLTRNTAAEAAVLAGKAENILLNIYTDAGKVKTDQELINLRGADIFLSGILPSAAKEIVIDFGNNNCVYKRNIVSLSVFPVCDESAIDRLGMLGIADSFVRNYQWQPTIDFGKNEKVVTLYTAFIVLEKIEDYIRFNITPPRELEGECDMNIFVKADAEKRREFKKQTEFEVLTEAANSYNKRLVWWNKNENVVRILNENEVVDKVIITGADKSPVITQMNVNTSSVPEDMENRTFLAGTEVVVTALGQTRQPKELGYAVTKIRRAELTQASSVNLQNGLTGKVSGLNVQTINNGVFADTRITLRGIRSLTGNNQPLLVLDGLPLESRYLNAVNPGDIQEVTVLKSPVATAIYGPDGVNGALILTTKNGSRYYGYYNYNNKPYKLKNCDDVEYLADLKSVPRSDKMEKYSELRKIYGNEPGFYFDVAQHLYESGYIKDADTILFSAAGVGKGDKRILKAIGYTLENWKQFDKAINVYTEIVKSYAGDLFSLRDLALAYFQNGNYQEAVDVYYRGIKMTPGDKSLAEQTMQLKSMMLQEMNAIIAVHSARLDLSNIRKEFIRPLNADLRITIDCNSNNYYSKLNLTEPDGTVCNTANQNSINGGRYSGGNKYYYYYTPEEYQIQNAVPGKYKIKVLYYDYNNRLSNGVRVPDILRIMTFRNLGKPDQSIAVENVIMDNQYGMVEIAEINWK